MLVLPSKSVFGLQRVLCDFWSKKVLPKKNFGNIPQKVFLHRLLYLLLSVPLLLLLLSSSSPLPLSTLSYPTSNLLSLLPFSVTFLLLFSIQPVLHMLYPCFFISSIFTFPLPNVVIFNLPTLHNPPMKQQRNKTIFSKHCLEKMF